MIKNGVILAGGNGTRLTPLTHVVNKHLIDVNGKFIIDYPINTLKQMGVENLTVILGGNHFSQVVDHLKDGRTVGMDINYVYQGEAKGIAQAINICKSYVCHGHYDDFVVILADNIYDGPIYWNFDHNKTGGGVILYKHPDLNRFGVASILNNKIVHIEEKPTYINSSLDNYAITGCYLFTAEYFDFFKQITPSSRHEFEIVDIIKAYNNNDRLSWTNFKGMWSDAGTHESIARCNQYFYDKSNGNT